MYKQKENAREPLRYSENEALHKANWKKAKIRAVLPKTVRSHISEAFIL
jgi:hypothetical protein